MKSQTSFETLIIMAVMVVIILILLVFNTDLSGTYSTKYSRDKIKTALEDISVAAEQAYNQGQGAKSRVFISLPNIIIKSTVEGQTLTFNIYYSVNSEGVTPVYKNLDFNVTGNLPSSAGNHWLIRESQGGSVKFAR